MTHTQENSNNFPEAGKQQHELATPVPSTSETTLNYDIRRNGLVSVTTGVVINQAHTFFTHDFLLPANGPTCENRYV